MNTLIYFTLPEQEAANKLRDILQAKGLGVAMRNSQHWHGEIERGFANVRVGAFRGEEIRAAYERRGVPVLPLWTAEGDAQATAEPTQIADPSQGGAPNTGMVSEGAPADAVDATSPAPDAGILAELDEAPTAKPVGEAPVTTDAPAVESDLADVPPRAGYVKVEKTGRARLGVSRK